MRGDHPRKIGYGAALDFETPVTWIEEDRDLPERVTFELLFVGRFTDLRPDSAGSFVPPK